MVPKRQELQTLLEQIIESGNVYFQPPASLRIEYPCFVYQRDSMDIKFASDSVYQRTQRYQVTLISRDPEIDVLDRVLNIPYCSYDRFYVADNLNHDVFTIYF